MVGWLFWLPNIIQYLLFSMCFLKRDISKQYMSVLVDKFLAVLNLTISIWDHSCGNPHQNASQCFRFSLWKLWGFNWAQLLGFRGNIVRWIRDTKGVQEIPKIAVFWEERMGENPLMIILPLRPSFLWISSSSISAFRINRHFSPVKRASGEDER